MNKQLILILLLFINSSVYSLDCPVEPDSDKYSDKVIQAIIASKSCDKGSSIAQACAFASSMDVQTTAEAKHQCELNFEKKLSSSDKEVYKALLNKCDNKYKDMDGTMYLSASAFCRLNVARLYSELYTSAE